MSGLGVVDYDSSVDPNASPLESVGTSTTPDTEISPPGSPFEPNGLFKDKRFLAKKKLARLTQEEKVWPVYLTLLLERPSRDADRGFPDIIAHSCRLLEDQVHTSQGDSSSKDQRRPQWRPRWDFCRGYQGTAPTRYCPLRREALC